MTNSFQMGLLLVLLTIVPFTIGQSTVSNLKGDCGRRFMCRICELSSGNSCFLCPTKCKAYYKNEKDKRDKTQSDTAAARKVQTSPSEAGANTTAVPPPTKPYNGRYTASVGATAMGVVGALTAGKAIHEADKKKAAAQGGVSAGSAKPGPPKTGSTMSALKEAFKDSQNPNKPDTGKDKKKKKRRKCIFCRNKSRNKKGKGKKKRRRRRRSKK